MINCLDFIIYPFFPFLSFLAKLFPLIFCYWQSKELYSIDYNPECESDQMTLSNNFYSGKQIFFMLLDMSHLASLVCKESELQSTELADGYYTQGHAYQKAATLACQGVSSPP